MLNVILCSMCGVAISKNPSGGRKGFSLTNDIGCAPILYIGFRESGSASWQYTATASPPAWPRSKTLTSHILSFDIR
jgi:hypothetical protein